MVRLLGRCLPLICLSRKKRQSLTIAEQHTAGAKHHQEKVNKLFVRRVESIRVTQQAAANKRPSCQTIAERPAPHKKAKCKAALQQKEKIVKPDDTELDCETHISDRRSKQKNRIKSKKKPSPPTKPKSDDKNKASPPPPDTSSKKPVSEAKSRRTPSPAPSSIVDIPEEEDGEHDDDTASSISSSSSISSEWSTTTYPDSRSSDKSEQLVINPLARRQSMPSTNLANRNDDTKHRSCVESFYLGREHVRPSSSPSLPKVREDCATTKTSQPSKRNDAKPAAKSKQVLQNVQKMIKDQSIQEQHFNDARQRESVRL